jgi:hypothetical protein
MGVTAGIFLASILLKEMRYLVYIRYLWFFVGLHGDKTYNTFCLWKHHVNAVINLRGVSTNKK